ncbi:hypothetical protein X766_16025 [Mesorhizobium sp. LSJC255A00]|uniref:hypothetical protein n=1 Tax=Mesorhizobium sp. LSJC255A00 TaxID=1287313 RepID=UPI0003CF4801|nr:hypothetical protein [Mesorhizobium sp. LSJC255A00]ESX17897.1 hypothetical protein X766_16025 [Mesorhizobium sp. LSJC255A00]
MNKREIKRRIALIGMKPNYRVINNMPGGAIICYVATAKIGHAIVRALRELAYQENAK